MARFSKEIEPVDPFERRGEGGVRRVCAECGKEVKRSKWDAKHFKVALCSRLCMTLHWTKHPNKKEHQRFLWRERKRRLRADPKRKKELQAYQRKYQNEWVKKKMKDPKWRERKQKHRRKWYKKKQEKVGKTVQPFLAQAMGVAKIKP